MCDNIDIAWLNDSIARLDKQAVSDASDYQNNLTKPQYSLGYLEDIVLQFSAWQGNYKPSLEHIHISVFAADHGIAEEGVSAFPQAVTAEMVKNFVNGGAAISVLARHLRAKLEIIDVGVKDFKPSHGVISQRVGNGTANFLYNDAMSVSQLEQSLQTGYAAAQRAYTTASQIFIGGEMGIANTSSATAIACLLLAQTPQQLTGAGTGLNQVGIQHKISILEQALLRCNDVNKDIKSSATQQQALKILVTLGGFEIAALTGAYLRCSQLGIPILVDGFIASVAALLSISIQPKSRDWMLFAHTSAEQGHKHILTAMNAKPILNLAMRLGEASGAAVSIPIIQQALLLHHQMASFAEAGVTNKDEEHPV
jgi:nicotinate-nucleotide--dimethylbenzimidazole phosphoribosyltransferase